MSGHTYADASVKAQKVHKRKAADFYPTPPDVTVALIEFLRSQNRLPRGEHVWEPACGDGAMSEVLKRHQLDVRSSDIRQDSGYGETGVDFLSAESDMVPWIITNPPFNFAVEFIERANSVALNSAMLLKSQFWHAAGRLHLFRHLPPTFILPLTWRPAFLEAERGSSPLMDVMWCVWSRGVVGATPRDTTYIPLARPRKTELTLESLLGGKTR